MTKEIDNLIELNAFFENLVDNANVVDHAEKDYLRDNPMRSLNFLETAYWMVGGGKTQVEQQHDNARNRYINKRREETFGSEIEISPKIASFLYHTYTEFNDPLKTHKDKEFSFVKNTALKASGMFLWTVYLAAPPSPLHVINTIGSAVIEGTALKKQSEEIYKKRNTVVETILNEYRLIEKTPGHYFLKIAEFEKYEDVTTTGRNFRTQTVSKYNNNGISPDLVIENLPSPEKELGR